MRALVYADLQADIGSSSMRGNPAQNLQLWRCRRFFNQMAELCEKHDCACVWDLGDTTDNRTSIAIPVIDLITEGIRKLPDHEGNLKLIGNHEQFYRDPRLHSGSIYDTRFAVIETFKRVKVCDRYVACVSYPYNEAEVLKWIEALPDKEKTTLLGHFQMKNARLDNGVSTSGIPLEAVRPFAQVLLGHVHRGQAMADNVHYVGSPFQQNWGEAGQEKRVGIFDLQSLQVEWISLDGYPTHHEVSLAEMKKIEPAENFYRVMLQSKDEARAFYKGDLPTYAIPVYNYSNAPAEVESDSSSPAAWSPADCVRKWVEKTGIPDGFTEEELIAAGVELLA